MLPTIGAMWQARGVRRGALCALVLFGCLLVVPGAYCFAAGTEPVINNLFMNRMMAALRAEMTSWFREIMPTIITVAGAIGTSFVIYTALRFYFAERSFSEFLWEIIWPLALIGALIGNNAALYQSFMGDWLWNGIVTEFAYANPNLGAGAQKAAEMAATDAAEKDVGWLAFLANMAIGDKAAAADAMAQVLFDFVMRLSGFLVYPIMLCSVAYNVFVVGVLYCLGPIVLVFGFFEWTRDYVKRWFAHYLGALFSIVVICFFMTVCYNGEWGNILHESFTIKLGADPLGDIASKWINQIAWAYTAIRVSLASNKIATQIFA